MNWNDLDVIWKRQELPLGTNASLESLRNSFESKHRKLATSLMVRDYAELSACGAVIAAYVIHWRKLGANGWPMGLAIFLILVVAFFFIRERLRVHSHRLGTEASLREKIEADLRELRHQWQLIKRVWAWYLVPCAAAMSIHGFVIFRNAPPRDVIREPGFVIGEILFFFLIVLFAWLINRRALLQRIEPRIVELQKLLNDLVSLE